jgi:superfamily II DNA/RNA helicase
VLNQCNYVVLDEADRMIDLGFEPQASATLALCCTTWPCRELLAAQAGEVKQLDDCHFCQWAHACN